jgi:hypothetical protein
LQIEMLVKALILALAMAGVPLAAVAAQGRLVSQPAETRRVTQPLAREVEALAKRGDVWFAYRLPAAPGGHQRCGGSHVLLESPREMLVMGRIERSTLSRVRLFTSECEVDTGQVPLVMLEGVTPDASAAWLTELARTPGTSRAASSAITGPAFSALALQAGDAATRSLIALARDDSRRDIRNRSLMALADRAGQQAANAIADVIRQDPEIDVKKTALSALSRLPNDEGVPLLIQIARTNKSMELRRQAMIQLGQSNDERAVAFFEEVLRK